MKSKIIYLLFVAAAFSRSSHAEEIPWTASPLNWINSQYNYENSPLNFKNSLNNYQNSPDNPNRKNIVNTLGFVIGYVTFKEDGGVNYWDNDGDRIGYTPPNTEAEKLGDIAYDPEGDPITVSIEEK